MFSENIILQNLKNVFLELYLRYKVLDSLFFFQTIHHILIVATHSELKYLMSKVFY